MLEELLEVQKKKAAAVARHPLLLAGKCSYDVNNRSYAERFSKAFRYALDGGKGELVIAQNAQSKGGAVWTAGIQLAKHLEHGYSDLRGQTVLELGTGTGLVGLVAAALGAHAVLTDMPVCLDFVRQNVDANAAVIAANASSSPSSSSSSPSSCGRVTVAELTWGETPVADFLARHCGGPPSLIVGSDLVYERALASLLLSVLLELMPAGSDTRFVYSSDLRGRDGFAAFLREADVHFIIEDVTAPAAAGEGEEGKERERRALTLHPDFTFNQVRIIRMTRRKEAKAAAPAAAAAAVTESESSAAGA